jgi:hypothetical protein
MCNGARGCPVSVTADRNDVLAGWERVKRKK